MRLGDPVPDAWPEPPAAEPWSPSSTRIAVTSTVTAVALLHVAAWCNVLLFGASQAGTGYPGPDAIPSAAQDAETMRLFTASMLAHVATLIVITVLCVVGRWQLQMLSALLFAATFLGMLIALVFATPALERAGW
jgi:hypothetical protein